MARDLMSDEEWAFFAPFVIETGPKRGRPPKGTTQRPKGAAPKDLRWPNEGAARLAERRGALLRYTWRQ